MENIEVSETKLEVNGVAVDVDVIAKDADLELNNNESISLGEKMKYGNDNKSPEGDTKVEHAENASSAETKSSDSSSSGADSVEENQTATEEVRIEENATETETEQQESDRDEKKMEGTVTSQEANNGAQSDSDAKGDETSPSSSSEVETGEVKIEENATETERQENGRDEKKTEGTVTSQEANNGAQSDSDAKGDETSPSTGNSPSKSPSKKKSPGKKRINRSRSQKQPVDYSPYENYTLSASQRQRRYFLTPPRGRASIPVPDDNCEIFCTNIPINVLETELIPLFERYGKIFELRLMMSMRNPKRNAGFAFVRYTASEAAKEATEKLENYEIVPGKHLSVRLSQPNLSLFVGNIHRGLTREQIHEKISSKTIGLVKTFVKNSLYEDTKNCGFCFLEYNSHSAALKAKNLLNHGNVWGRQLFVDWAQRRKQFDERELQESKTLFINYLPKETTEEQITETLGAFGTVEKVTKIKDYAFVLFTDHQAAVNAMDGADKAKLGNDAIEISLALPKTMKTRNRFPSFSYRRSRPSRRHNSYNRYNYASFGPSSNKFFMRKQADRRRDNSATDVNTDDAGQTTLPPSLVVTPPEPLSVC